MRRPNRVTPRQIIAVVIVAVTALFIVQNRGAVEVWLFTIVVTAPLWLLLVVMIALGMLLELLISRRR